MIKYIIQIVASCLMLMVSFNSHAGLADDLRDGQNILLIRHADAPGFGDPPGYRLDECSSQRNLGDYGIRQATLIGQWLTAQGVSSAQVFSSPWCRCLDTAKLIDKGPVMIEASLGSFFDQMHVEKDQTLDLQKFIQQQLAKAPRQPIILVTHHVNIEAYTGKNVKVGDMVLVNVDRNGKPRSHKLYPSPSAM